MLLTHPALERLIAAEDLAHALALLQPGELAVAMLRADGLTDVQIGLLLDINPATVSARLARARARIVRCIPELRVFLDGRVSPATRGAPQVTGLRDVFTPAALAETWGVTPTTVRRWCAQGRLPDAWRTEAGHWRIPAEALRDFQPPASRGGDRRSARYREACESQEI
jgi:DNA-binding CsgD family transcriptional regulator